MSDTFKRCLLFLFVACAVLGLYFAFRTSPVVRPRRVYPAIRVANLPAATASLPAEVSSTINAPSQTTPTLRAISDNIWRWVDVEAGRNNTSRDIHGLTTKLRLWSGLKDSELKMALENQLFGWIGRGKTWPNVASLTGSWKKGRGIVIGVGNRFAPLALNLVRSIREVFKSSISIYIYYLGEDDLKAELRKVFLEFGANNIEDLKPVFSEELDLHGWDMKPFAMLACPWEEVMLIDADTVLMQSPETFFDDPGYREHGALFFLDRGYGGEEGRRQWFERILPKPLSDLAKKSTFYRKTSNYMQESGVVLIDKSRHKVGSLAVGLLNTPIVREELHSFTHGDKESYWIGFEMAEESYSWMDTPAGSISVQRDYESDPRIVVLCGRVAHFDRQGNLMWFNDSILDRKNVEPKDFKGAPLRWAHSTWEWAGLCCRYDPLKITVPDGWPNHIREPWELSKSEIAHLHQLINLFLIDPMDRNSSLWNRSLAQAKGDADAERFYRL